SLPKPPCPDVDPGDCKTKVVCYGVSGASSCKIKRSSSLSGPYTTIKTGGTPGSSYYDTSCENSKLYYTTVSAIVNGWESPDSDPAASMPTAGLPSPWQTKDIGSVSAVGSASYDGNTRKMTVIGSGEDIWNSSDEFRFAYIAASGNCTIIARVLSVEN